MTKNEFLKQLSDFFSDKGFICKKMHFYKEITSEVLIVFGLYASKYGEYYYLENGFCFKSISKFLPFPKYNQLNLNCGRIMFDKGKALCYNEFNENDMFMLKQKLGSVVNSMINISTMEKEKMIQLFLTGSFNESLYILGDETAKYFDLPRDVFQFHFVQS